MASSSVADQSVPSIESNINQDKSQVNNNAAKHPKVDRLPLLLTEHGHGDLPIADFSRIEVLGITTNATSVQASPEPAIDHAVPTASEALHPPNSTTEVKKPRTRRLKRVWTSFRDIFSMASGASSFANLN